MQNLRYAAAYYKQVLEESSKMNIYAANGIGVVLAEKGELVKAKDIFSRVLEASTENIECVLINLGHVLLALGKHGEAIRMYEKSSANKSKGSLMVQNYIGYAYFDWAKEAESMEGSKVSERSGC